jgi:hypothetical protein
MRIYITGNDGITLCREAPAAVNEGEIMVASSEQLHAARLSGKRLLALWNALPGVEIGRILASRCPSSVKPTADALPCPPKTRLPNWRIGPHTC